MRIYCKNGYIVGTDPLEDSKETVRASFGPQSIATPKGELTVGGIILFGDSLKTGGDCHEIIVVESATPGISPGDRALVYLGGDDGDVQATGISAFFPLGERPCFSVPEAFVWALVKDGEIIPRGKALLVERDDAAMKRYAMNDSPIIAPDVVMVSGVSATGSKDPYDDGARKRDSVTVLYCRVVRSGELVREGLERGALVCFSPSYSCARLERSTRGLDGTLTKCYYALVDSEEVFFTVGD